MLFRYPKCICMCVLLFLTIAPLQAQNHWTLHRAFRIADSGGLALAQGQGYLFFNTPTNGDLLVTSNANMITAPLVDGTLDMVLPNFTESHYAILFVVPDPGAYPQFSPHIEVIEFDELPEPATADAYIYNKNKPYVYLHPVEDQVYINNGFIPKGGVSLKNRMFINYDYGEAGYLSKQTAQIFDYVERGVTGAVVDKIGLGGVYFKLPQPVTTLDIAFWDHQNGAGYKTSQVSRFMLVDFLSGKVLTSGQLTNRTINFNQATDEVMVIFYKDDILMEPAPIMSYRPVDAEWDPERDHDDETHSHSKLSTSCKDKPDKSSGGTCYESRTEEVEYNIFMDTMVCVDGNTDGNWDPPPATMTPGGSVSLCNTLTGTLGGSFTTEISGEAGISSPVGPSFKVGTKTSTSISAEVSGSSQNCDTITKFVGYVYAQRITTVQCCYECITDWTWIPGGGQIPIVESHCDPKETTVDPPGLTPCTIMN